MRVHGVFRRHETRDGTYPTYFTALGESNACPPDYGNRPSLGVNIDVLAFFEHYGFAASRLLHGLDAVVKTPNYWENAVYYPSLPVLSQLSGTLASEWSC